MVWSLPNVYHMLLVADLLLLPRPLVHHPLQAEVIGDKVDLGCPLWRIGLSPPGNIHREFPRGEGIPMTARPPKKNKKSFDIHQISRTNLQCWLGAVVILRAREGGFCFVCLLFELVVCRLLFVVFLYVFHVFWALEAPRVRLV